MKGSKPRTIEQIWDDAVEAELKRLWEIKKKETNLEEEIKKGMKIREETIKG